jgi:hypothetical protein
MIASAKFTVVHSLSDSVCWCVCGFKGCFHILRACPSFMWKSVLTHSKGKVVPVLNSISNMKTYCVQLLDLGTRW